MKFSSLPIKVLADAPHDATTINHQLLVRAGFVNQLMAGVFTYLPLGLRVIRKIAEVVRQEMDGIGGLEIQMPSLHPAANWQQTGAWDSVDVLFKLASRTGRDYALGQSHEEVVTPLAKEFVKSYKNLPLALYQIQWKFRDELRAKSGILRGREFWMKDMYSFHTDQADFDRFYGEVKAAYLRIFSRLGLTAKVTEASGGAFSTKISYEFMVLTDAGEDDILYCPDCEFCVNTEIAKQKEGDTCPKCSGATAKLKKARAAEVGNVFDLGQKYTKDFEFTYAAADGSMAHPIMGCYGIGISRTMGVIVEASHDERGMVWPESVAPFRVHLISLRGAEEAGKALYQNLQSKGVEVFWDDREESPGRKFSDADLFGMPVRLVVSQKTDGKVEWKTRTNDTIELLEEAEVVRRLTA